MEPVSSNPATNPVSTGKSRRRQPFGILVACILIATSLWFLRALENEYSTHIEHPVRYINQPEKMMTMNPLPQKLSLEVKGLGFSILKHNWDFSKTPLTIDFRTLISFSGKRKKGQIEYIPMSTYMSEFSTQLKDLRVITIKPDTLLFRFSHVRSVRLPVKANLAYESGAAVVPDSLFLLEPDSITVEGPDLILDTLRSVSTIPVRMSRQGTRFSRLTELESIHKTVTVIPEKVTVSFGDKN